MSLTVPNQGEVLMLEAALGKANASVYTLRLFSNNHAPANTDTEANYTECAGGGYSAIALDASLWVTTPGAPTSSSYPEQTFTFTGATNAPGNVYGYYITNESGQLVMAEQLAGVFVPANNGDTVKVTPNITFGSTTND